MALERESGITWDCTRAVPVPPLTRDPGFPRFHDSRIWQRTALCRLLYVPAGWVWRYGLSGPHVARGWG